MDPPSEQLAAPLVLATKQSSLKSLVTGGRLPQKLQSYMWREQTSDYPGI